MSKKNIVQVWYIKSNLYFHILVFSAVLFYTRWHSLVSTPADSSCVVNQLFEFFQEHVNQQWFARCKRCANDVKKHSKIHYVV